MEPTNSNWSKFKFLSAPSEVVQRSQWIAEGDDLAILTPYGLNADLTNGDGPMAKAVTVIGDVKVNDRLVSVEQIDKILITLTYGINRSRNTQGLITLGCCGSACSYSVAYGDSDATPLTKLELEIPVSDLASSSFPNIIIFLSMAAQRSKSTEFFHFGVDAVDFRLWRK